MIYFIKNTTELISNPNIGFPLADAISCTVTEERNGRFDLDMTYPRSGVYGELLAPNTIILAQSRKEAALEPFRVYDCETDLNGIITVRAHHIAYDLDGAPMLGTELDGHGITECVAALNNSLSYYSFTYLEIVNDGITDEATAFHWDIITSVWNRLGGDASLLGLFGGELSYHWDFTTSKCLITVHAARGTAKETPIKYGVNIVTMNRLQTVGNMYSNVMGWWEDTTYGTNSYTASTGVTDVKRTLILDLRDVFEPDTPWQTVQTYINKYIAKHEFGTQTELTVEYVPLDNTTDYEEHNIAIVGLAIVGTSIVGNIENAVTYDGLDLCDTTTVEALQIGVTAQAKCVATVFDALLNKYANVTIGTMQSTVIDSISNLMIADATVVKPDNEKKPLWKGSWSSGDITVPNIGNYRIFAVRMSGQATNIIASIGGASDTYFRGVGGYAATSSTDAIYYLSATLSGTTLTMVDCHSRANDGTVTARTVTEIIGLV